MEEKSDTKILQVATQAEMAKILDRLKPYLPHSAVAYGVLQAHLRYEGLSAIRSCTVLYAQNSSLVVLILKNPKGGLQILTPFWDVEEEDENDIIQLLSTMPEFNWSEPFLCNPSPLELVHKIEAMITRGQIGNGDFIPSQPIETALMYGLTSALKEKLRLPEGFQMRTIKDSDAQHFHDQWKYNISMSLESYRVLLKEVPGFAIIRCRKDPDEMHKDVDTTEQEVTPTEKSSRTQDTGKASPHRYLADRALADKEHQGPGSTASPEGAANYQNPSNCAPLDDPTDEALKDGDHQLSDITLPVAWSHLSMNYTISNTFTLPPFRRQGLSKAVTVALTQKLLQEIGVAFAFIEEDNVASIKLHEQLGFTKQSTTGWQYYRKRSCK